MSINRDDEKVDISKENYNKVGIDINIPMSYELQKVNKLTNRIRSYEKIMLPVIRQQEMVNKITAISGEIASSLSKVISESIPPYYEQLAVTMQNGIGEVLKNYRSEALESMVKMISAYQLNFSNILTGSVQQILSQIDFSGLYCALSESIKIADFRVKINNIVLSETYSAKWFPHALSTDECNIQYEFLEIIVSTKRSKNRIKKIDKLILDYYSRQKIEVIKKSWRQDDISEYKYRIMHQAVQAYHRKEYAITVTVLSTMWEGLIYDKAKDTRGKKGKLTKENFSKLISNDDHNQVFADFFDEYIMYDCRSEAEVKADVPGRNSSSHSFYNKYPSRKAALNAILFTDFLVKLKSLNIENIY